MEGILRRCAPQNDHSTLEFGSTESGRTKASGIGGSIKTRFCGDLSYVNKIESLIYADSFEFLQRSQHFQLLSDSRIQPTGIRKIVSLKPLNIISVLSDSPVPQPSN
jgi:hypothetical protein